jgi:hypothetical protein
MHFCKSCDECQKIENFTFSTVAKLVMALLLDPFMKWGLDFIRLVKAMGRYTGNKPILVMMDYTTKWVEAKVLHSNMVVV